MDNKKFVIIRLCFTDIHMLDSDWLQSGVIDNVLTLDVNMDVPK